jgi:hypothetical protein
MDSFMKNACTKSLLLSLALLLITVDGVARAAAACRTTAG